MERGGRINKEGSIGPGGQGSDRKGGPKGGPQVLGLWLR